MKKIGIEIIKFILLPIRIVIQFWKIVYLILKDIFE